MDDILLLSTGGTFNKVYNRINGTLEIDKSAYALHKIQEKWLSIYPVDTIIHKDSLDFTPEDREQLKHYILNSPYSKIVVIHGTDTMHLSAKVVAKALNDKTIIFTGAMVPFSIDPIEATANLASAIGFLHATNNASVYIALNGRVAEYSEIKKNREEGYFDYVTKENSKSN